MNRRMQDGTDLDDRVAALESALERKLFEQRFLLQVAEALDDAADPEVGIDRVLTLTTSALGSEGASLLLLSGRGGDLFFKHSSGEGSDKLARHRLSLGEGIAGWVARENEPVICNDPRSDRRHKWEIARDIGVPARSLLCVPLRIEERAVGALELVNKVGGTFTEDDLALLTLVAAFVSKPIQRALHREAEARAERLADLGRILSGILHDLKTPLGVISGYGDLSAGENDPERRAEYRTMILRQCERIRALTHEVLAFARGESNILMRKVSVPDLFMEVERDLRPLFIEHKIKFSVDVRYRGAARCDEGKLLRAIYNLSHNAYEAMPDGGRFRIEVTSSEGELTIRFEDDGPGIPEEICDRVFESFVSAGKPGGTGLGLSIVKKVVEEHGGRIDFESRRGQGTTFDLRLPLGI